MLIGAFKPLFQVDCTLYRLYRWAWAGIHNLCTQDICLVCFVCYRVLGAFNFVFIYKSNYDARLMFEIVSHGHSRILYLHLVSTAE